MMGCLLYVSLILYRQDGIELAPESLFGYQCLTWLYCDSSEYETGLEYATKGKDLVLQDAKNFGRLLDRWVNESD
jgi:hypothetical protein